MANNGYQLNNTSFSDLHLEQLTQTGCQPTLLFFSTFIYFFIGVNRDLFLHSYSLRVSTF